MAIIDNSLFQLNAPSASTPLGDATYNHVTHHQSIYDELNSIEDSLVQGYVRESASVSYNSSNSFIVAGDVTTIYTPGRIVRFSDGTTAVVSSSSYSSPNTIVNIVQGTVPSNLSYVDISLQPKGGTNQFLKASGSDINTGTEDAKIVTPKAIADSNVVIADKGFSNNLAIKQKDSEGTERNVLKLNSSNVLEIGNNNNNIKFLASSPGIFFSLVRKGGDVNHFNTPGTTTYFESGNVLIQIGSLSVGTINAGQVVGITNNTFPISYSYEPLMLGTIIYGAFGEGVSLMISPTATFFDVWLRNNSSNNATNIRVGWIAIGKKI